MVVDETNVKLPKASELINSKHKTYEIIKLLGRGGFGAVYLVKRVKDDKRFAMKCEIIEPEKQVSMGFKFYVFDLLVPVKSKVLMMDCKVLQGTASIKSPHFCKIVDRGKAVDRFNYLVMTLLGPNLWDLRMNRDGQKFSMNTSLKAAQQCLMAIEDLHRVGFLHRDVKPGNYCVGRRETNDFHVVYMLDFGLCRKFCGDTEDKDLRMPRDSAPFRGTTRYAPIAALTEKEQSRKDDIEAWLYMVIEWTAGSLPWRHLTGKEKQEVLAWKVSIRDDETCMDQFLAGCPKREFSAIFTYLFGLKYAHIPDYSYCYYCIVHAMRSMNCDPVEPLDWDLETPYHGPTVEDRNKRIQLVVKEETKQDLDEKKPQ